MVLEWEASQGGFRLLGLAEKWLDLAERSERAAAQPQRPFGDHPLVRKTLGSS
jgi:hypothetical protein